MRTVEEVSKSLFDGIKSDTEYLSQYEDYSDINKSEIGKQLISQASFESLGLSNEIIVELYKNKIDKPTLIQEQCIPKILQGVDAAFHSKSGTGKTIGYSTGILSKVKQGKGVQAVVVSPTRELNSQIATVIAQIGSGLGIGVCCANKEFNKSNISEEVVIGCPGKILSLIDSKAIRNPERILITVFDETDFLLKSNFFAIQTIKLAKLLENAQKIFISATYSELARNALLKISPNVVSEITQNKKPQNIKLFYLEVEQNKKISVLVKLFEILQISSVITFCNSKKMVETIAYTLEKENFPVEMIHGDIDSAERDRRFDNFRSGRTKYLISTDVSSRGIDVQQVNLVINFDLPTDRFSESTSTYLHRIGRSGRFNRPGFVIDFICSKSDLDSMTKIHSQIGESSELFTIDALLQRFEED